MKALTLDLTKTTPGSTLAPAEYQHDDLTARLIMKYERGIVWRPEGAGPCEAVAVPSGEERRILASRAANLHRSLVSAQASDVDRRKIGAAIARMLGGYTVLRNSDTRALVAGLVQDLWQFPAWATVTVCDKVHDGKYADIKPEFPPTVPQLCQHIRAEMAPVIVEQTKIDSTLALVVRDREMTPDEIEKRRATAQSWLKRDDARAAALLGSLPGQSTDDTRRVEALNQRVFERECRHAGIDPSCGVSPTLMSMLNKGDGHDIV